MDQAWADDPMGVGKDHRPMASLSIEARLAGLLERARAAFALVRSFLSNRGGRPARASCKYRLLQQLVAFVV